MKPNTRKTRMQWLCEKKGIDYVMSMYSLTDREVKDWFESVYPLYKNSPNYKSELHHPECLVCNSEVRITWDCACGENVAIIDEDDPELEERREKWKRS
jgi:hypothetical protein